jgi:hypothetical protein
MAYPLSWSSHLCNWKSALLQSKTSRRKTVKLFSHIRGLIICGRPGGKDRKVAPIISHISFRFAIVFMFAVLGQCESLIMLEK